ncbi:MAG TPA: TlpA disulfide reductase family protein [Candidatus Acidoferrales bacterium]|nr:TlpA disulfide reductase family protein [Candidatus Acidoferrales bacterium]
MSVKTFLSRSGGTAVLVAVLAASLGLNVYLARTGVFPHGKAPAALKVNAVLPATLPLQDADGKAVSLNFASDARPTVLYVLSPLCSWCKRNEPNMKALYSATNSRFRYVGLSIESKDLKKYIADGREPFPVYYVSDKNVDQKLGITGTPETIVVSPQAKVEQVWQGAYLDVNQKEVQKFFDVKLPGLQEVAAAE